MKYLPWLTFAFILFIAGVVWVANSPEGPDRLEFVRAIPYGDKLGHFFLMGVASFLVTLLMQGKGWRLGKFLIPFGAFLVGEAVFLEEMTQLYLPTRTFSFEDLMADFLGIVVWGGIGVWCNKIWRVRIN